LGDQYLSRLGPWHDMLALGLTTFAEKPEPTRSDCHAWSATPIYELLATVCGIEPASPGFATVRIAPHLGHLTEVNAAMPHPQGEITVSLRRNAHALRAEIVLPKGVSGEFVWTGRSIALRSGAQRLELNHSSEASAQSETSRSSPSYPAFAPFRLVAFSASPPGQRSP